MNEWNARNYPGPEAADWRPVVLKGDDDDPDHRINVVVPQMPGDAIAWLRKEFPLGSFWYVHTWDGHKSGMIWCAWYRGKNYQADSPGHLAEYIAGADIPGGAA